MAYGVKYTIPFVDIDDNQFVIKISEKDYNGGEPTELIGGSEPIVISYKDDEDLYNPLRFAGATITVLVEENKFDLYAIDPHQFKVDLYKEDELKYTGFITPEVFSQDYNGYLTQFQIETISALSTLEYFRFEPSEDVLFFKLFSGTNDPTMFGILDQGLALIKDSYTRIYLPKIFGTSESSYTLTKLDCLRANFVDDDDEFWTYKDFLEEFCRFFGWTLTEKDGNAYFLDLDYIKSGNTQYFNYVPATNSLQPTTLTNALQTLTQEDSTGDDNKVELLPAYNKVVIVDSDYEYGTLFPKLENMKGLSSENYTKLFEHTHGSWVDKRAKQSWTIYRYLPTNKNIKLFAYKASGSGLEELPEYPSTWAEIDACAGSSVQRHQRWNNSEFDEVVWEYGPVYTFKNFLGGRTNDWDYSVGSRTNYLTTNTLLMNGGNSDTWNGNGYPCLEIKAQGVYAYNTFLQLNFEMAANHFMAGVYCNDPIFKNDTYGDVANNKGYRVPCKLQFGDRYWSGSRWQTAETIFEIQMEWNKGDHTASGRFRRIKNNMDGSNFNKGYIMPVNASTIGSDRILIGDIILTMYFPRYEWNTGKTHYGAAFAFIKDLELNLDTEEEDPYIEAKQDTIFEGSTKSEDSTFEYMNTFNDVELKITTSEEGKSVRSYSKLFQDYRPVSKLIHMGIKDHTDGSDQSNTRPEYQLLYKYLGQYHAPKLRLTQDTNAAYKPYELIEDSGFPGKKFIIVNEEINYRDNKSNLTMQEVL